MTTAPLRRSPLLPLTLCLAIGLAGRATTAQVQPLGQGSYASHPPAGGKEPQREIFRTAAVTGPMPTQDWWSSIAWMTHSERHYAHPLAFQTSPRGLHVGHPGPAITANAAGIFGFIGDKAGDLTLGLSDAGPFPESRIDGFSDWFVAVLLADGPRRLRVTYGHGSPFVYTTVAGARPRLTFAKPPEVWSGTAADATLGVTIAGRHYGLFGPAGSTWAGVGTATLTNDAAGKDYFSLAVLPARSAEALDLFRRHAHAHVTDTRVAWSYDPATSDVTTRFTFTTQAREGTERGTLTALYPHQWRHLGDGKLTGDSYPSVRGTMRLLAGDGFSTRMRFTGVLPSLPVPGDLPADARAEIREALAEELKQPVGPPKDTYWDGKLLGKWATLVPLAEQLGDEAAAAELRRRLRERLESWLTAANAPAADGPATAAKPGGFFALNKNWGTLIGYPASFGSDVELNDHHFHYGYFIKAAAELARLDPAWAGDARFGGMVRLLVRDIASPDRADPLFPFLRAFDPYAGHSWASGHARFGDGNNHESSSEAMNAWTGMILLGQATNDTALRDLGVWLHTTELAAIEEYWFDVHRENHPKAFTAGVATMVWGGKGAHATWFTANPEMVHGINWLPIHGGSLYLGRHPGVVAAHHDLLVKANKGEPWDEWADLVLMHQALADPDAALRRFGQMRTKLPSETGNSRANLLHWMHSLKSLGQVDAGVTADMPLHAVFRKAGMRTYVAWPLAGRPGAAPKGIRFSDGTMMAVERAGVMVRTP